jgi:Concanavalin A-like lectin/glucanases superfamily
MNLLKATHPKSTRASWPQNAASTAGCLFAGICLAASSLSAQTLMEFNFNEGSGDTVTSTDGKLVGTLLGPTFSTDTPSGLAGDYSLQFALDQRVSVPDPNKLLALDPVNPSFTIEAWLKFTTPTNRAVFFFNNGPGGAVSASVFTNRTLFVTTLGIVDQSSKAAIPDDGGWHHVAIVHENKKEFRFYVDGTLGDTVPYTQGGNFTRTNQVFYIGAENVTNTFRYAGNLDRLRYSKGALTADQLDSNAAPPAVRPAGAVYPAPAGGWTYILNGDKDTAGADGSGFTSLDGTWSHDNDSDEWDGSKLGGTFADGVNTPGGIMSITEDGVTFLRLQDPGDPRIAGFNDPCNRKLYLGHDISGDGVTDTLLDDGVTLTFRARIPTPANTKAPIDQLYPYGATAPVPYPAGGDGYVNSDGGKGNFGIKQKATALISFSLTVPTDTYDDSDPSIPPAQFSGLTMNRLATNVVSAEVDFPNSTNAFRGVALDPTQWHEFWITIKADTNGVGTHVVSVYMDGSTTGTNMVVTAGNGDDYAGTPYLGMGGSRTAESYALDVDFFAYKIGAEAPTGGTVAKPQFSSSVRNSGKVVITWTGGGTLQTTTALSGTVTWADVTGVSSPATITVADPARFYRIKQ